MGTYRNSRQKFLYSIKDYFDATYMWGEDALLQRISIYLKGDAQEWITYLRKKQQISKIVGRIYTTIHDTL